MSKASAADAPAADSGNGSGLVEPKPLPPVTAGAKVWGVVFALYVVFTPLWAVLFLLLPALVLLVPGLPAPGLRLRVYRDWVLGVVINTWLRLPVALLELRPSALVSGASPLQIVVSGDAVPPNPNAAFVMIANHPSRVDWLVLWSWWTRYASLRAQKIALKHGLKAIPGSGWAMQFANFLFLRRVWADDKQQMRDWIDAFLAPDSPPCQLLLFPEGTNLTAETRGIDNKFVAKTPGLTPYTHVLHPRTTGFVHLIQSLRAANAGAATPAVDAVYDVTIAYPDARGWTEVDLCKGLMPARAHFHFERVPLSTLPAEDAQLTEWCANRFADKEQRLARFRQTDSFEPNPIPAPVPYLSYGVSIALWTLVSALSVYGLWASWVVRVYALAASVGTFAWLKSQGPAGGIDALTLKWTRIAERAAAAEAGAAKRD